MRRIPHLSRTDPSETVQVLAASLSRARIQGGRQILGQEQQCQLRQAKNLLIVNNVLSLLSGNSLL